LKWITNSNTTQYPTKQAAIELHTILQDLESSKSLFNNLPSFDEDKSLVACVVQFEFEGTFKTTIVHILRSNISQVKTVPKNQFSSCGFKQENQQHQCERQCRIRAEQQ